MCLECQAPLGELLSLRTYGRAFSRTDRPSFRVRWSDDGQVVSWADGKLCLSDFRCFAQRSIESAETLLDQMMYGSRPMIDLNSLHDDMSAMKHGYSFIQDPRNKLTTKYLELSSEACLSSVNGLMSGESWNSKAVQNYLDQDHELLKQLGLVMHLTGGQAPRSTELSVLNARMARLLRAAYTYTMERFVTSRDIRKLVGPQIRNSKSPVTSHHIPARSL